MTPVKLGYSEILAFIAISDPNSISKEKEMKTVGLNLINQRKFVAPVSSDPKVEPSQETDPNAKYLESIARDSRSFLSSIGDDLPLYQGSMSIVMKSDFSSAKEN